VRALQRTQFSNQREKEEDQNRNNHHGNGSKLRQQNNGKKKKEKGGGEPIGGTRLKFSGVVQDLDYDHTDPSEWKGGKRTRKRHSGSHYSMRCDLSLKKKKKEEEEERGGGDHLVRESFCCSLNYSSLSPIEEGGGVWNHSERLL